MDALFNRTIQAAADWPEEDRKAFTEMAEAAREDFVTKGDWTFVNEFCAKRGIATGGCASHCTVETNFIMLMNPVWGYYSNLRAQKEDAEKREMYTNMLKSGRRDELEQMILVLRKDLSARRNVDIYCREDPEMGRMESVLAEFVKKETIRKYHEQQAENMKQHEETARLARIEEEARRRIAREGFEAAVQAKIHELKGLR
jgi:hypothetical protein